MTFIHQECGAVGMRNIFEDAIGFGEDLDTEVLVDGPHKRLHYLIRCHRGTACAPEPHA